MILFSLIVFVSTILICLILSNYADQLNLIDYPNKRKIHTKPTPVVGGIGIFITIYLSLLFLDISYQIKVIIFSTSIVLVFGAIDDSKNLDVRIRLVAQIVASLIVMGTGISIINLGSYQYLSFFDLKLFGLLLTVVCVVGLTNAINFMDGIDGLSSGLILHSIVTLFIFSYFDKGIMEVNLFILIFFCTLGFFILNMGIFANKKIFLGDAGSMTLGFLLAWLLIYYSHPTTGLIHPVLTLWCVPIPFYDLLGVIIRRVKNKFNPFIGDRTHIHHILLDVKLSKYIVLLIIIFSSFVLSLIGLLSYVYLGPDFSLIIFFVFFLIYQILTFKIYNKLYFIKK